MKARIGRQNPKLKFSEEGEIFLLLVNWISLLVLSLVVMAKSAMSKTL